MKGALVEFASSFSMAVPNVVVFQFNPETLRHTWSQPPADTSGANPLAVKGAPGEAFSFTLSMDATDELVGPGFPPLGLASRIAALEKLMFPVSASSTDTLGGVANAGGQQRSVPASQLPTVLFVWGPGRILPVRIASLTITEKIFDDLLYPTHADAALELRVLTPTELDAVTGPLADLARAAYDAAQSQRSILALANLGDAARQVIALIPSPIG